MTNRPPRWRAARLAMTLSLCVACEPAPPGASLDADPAPVADAAVEATPDAAPPIADADLPSADAAIEPDAALDPWPEPLPAAMAGVTLVYEGGFVTPGFPLLIDAPPAGVQAPMPITLTLTWRGEGRLALDADPAAWLDAPGFGWASPPPAALDAGASTRLELVFDPTVAVEAGDWPATLALPGTGASYDLVARVARPLRMAFVTSSGEVWVSDAYGLDARPVADALPPTARHSLAWGDGLFFRTYASGPEWADPGRYAYSVDGAEWHLAEAADAFWSSKCAWGIDRLSCATDSRLAWSYTGATVQHAAQSWNGLINDMIFHRDRWIGVGRNNRRAVSFDGEQWTHETRAHAEGVPDTFYDGVDAFDDDTLIAVGARNGLVISTSHDRGMSWTAFAAGEGIQPQIACKPGHCIITATNADPGARQTVDGVEWTPIALGIGGLTPFASANGWFFARTSPWRAAGALYRSRDGVEWELLVQLEEPGRFEDLAIEGWEPSR